MSRYVKMGVSIPQELYVEIDKIMSRMGIRNRSRFIQMIIREHILSYYMTYERNLEVVGIIAVYYDHTKKDLDRLLIDVQHDFLDIIISLQHIHVTKRFCVEMISVRGSLSRVEELLKKIGELEITHLKHILFPVIDKT